MTDLPRFLNISQQHYFLLGPRGTGKSTYLRQKYSSALWIDLLDQATYRNYLARPERLADVGRNKPGKNEL